MAPKFIKLILLAGLTLQWIAIAHAAPTRYITYDLDGTLVDNLVDRGTDRDEVIELQGRNYRVADFATWMVAKINQHPNVKSVFFSGALEERNIPLLQRLGLHDIAHRILSHGHLVKPTTAPPTELSVHEQMLCRYLKKDLEQICSDLNNIIIVDDWADFAPDHQSANVLSVGFAYYPFASYEAAREWLALNPGESNEKYTPPTPYEWFRHKYRLLRVYNILMESLEENDRDESTNFRDLVAQKNGEPYLMHIERGLKRLENDCEFLFVRHSNAIANEMKRL